MVAPLLQQVSELRQMSMARASCGAHGRTNARENSCGCARTCLVRVSSQMIQLLERRVSPQQTRRRQARRRSCSAGCECDRRQERGRGQGVRAVQIDFV